MDEQHRFQQSKATLEYLRAHRFPGVSLGPVIALKIGDEVMHRLHGRGVVTDTWTGQATVLFQHGNRIGCPTVDLFLWKCVGG